MKRLFFLSNLNSYLDNAIKINGEELTAEQKQKIMENKTAVEKQITEKQRLKALEAEREQMENERLEKERHLIELKEKLENQKELTRWKELQREEERREALVKEALEKARLEAQIHRKQKLHKHANSSRSIDNSDHSINNNNNEIELITSTNSSDILSDSAISASLLNLSTFMNSAIGRARENLMVETKNLPFLPSSANFIRDSSDYSVFQTSAIMTNDSRSQSLPPSQNDEHFRRSPKTNNAHICNVVSPTLNIRSAADERPIKPMDENAYNDWQKLAAEDASEEHNSEVPTTIRRPKVKKVATKDTIRKSRSVVAPKAPNTRRSESLDNQNPSKQPVKQLQDSKIVTEKVEKLEETVKTESRLPSAATYIISRGAIFDPKEQPKEKTTGTTKTLSPRKNVSVAEPFTVSKLVKSKSESAFKTLLIKKSNIDIPANKECTLKTDYSNDSRNIAAPDLVNRDDISNSNPWGDQFGGLNPLLHRLSTRKKLRQIQLQQHLDSNFNSSSSLQPTKVLSKTQLSGTPSPQKEPTVKVANNSNTTPKFPNQTPEKCSQSLKGEKKSYQSFSNNNDNASNPLLQKISTRKKLAANSMQDVKFFSEGSGNNKDTVVLAKSVANESVKDDNSLRLSKNDVGDVDGGDMYRSFAMRTKQASEKQSDMLKQLSSLKEQLKMSQRVVENSLRTKAPLSKPEAVVAPNTRICKQV
uniref:Uncharacterized protein n=1 Tax=Romanomermis culicivorax TaxID=13658 RepID=A0A915I3X2_ROMCU